MFYCQLTGELSKPGQKPHRLTVHTRERTYTKWVRNDENAANINRELILDHSHDNKWLEVFVAKGWEIVQEINVNDEGLQLWNGWTEEERQEYVRHAYPHFFKNENKKETVTV